MTDATTTPPLAAAIAPGAATEPEASQRSQRAHRRRLQLPGALHSRLALWYSGLITVVLVAYTAAVYFFAVVEPDATGSRAGGDSDEEAEERTVAEQHLLVVLGVGLLASLGTSMLGTLIITRRMTAPLSAIVSVFRQLDLDELQTRVAVPVRGADEIKELGSAINATLARLERSVGGLRRFTADASHELRTPLARVQAELELALRNNDLARVGDALEEVGALTRLLESLLTLAHVDAGDLGLAKRADLAVVRVDHVVRDVVDSYDLVAAERGITLKARIDDAVLVNGDAMALKRIVSNLVDNAYKFTPDAGEIAVDVARAGDVVKIVVADTGSGVAEADRTRIFERFYRAEKARALPGAGLGLSITRDLARAHGGDVRLVPSEKGATFLVELPLRPA